MKRKSIGGRARLSKLPPRPSNMAFSYLGQTSVSEANPDHDDFWVNEANDDVHRSKVPETPNHDRRSHELAPDTTGETVVAETSHGFGLGRQGIHRPKYCLEIDWIEKEVCIKCDEGGKLLVCSDRNCPLAVHEECMHCSAWFDGMGNFYCPYCSYRRAMLKSREARKKAMLAKKALSGFLDEGMMDGRVKRKKSIPSAVEGDQGEKRFEPDFRTNICLCKGAEVSATSEQNFVLSTCGDYARPDGGGQHEILAGQQEQPGRIIACGGGGGGGGGGGSAAACLREGEIGNLLETVQAGKSLLAENQNLVNDHQIERVVQDEQQSSPLFASPVEKEEQLDSVLHMSMEGELDNRYMVKDHETSVSTSEEDSIQQEHAKASDTSNGDWGNVSTPRRRIEKKNQNVVQTPYVDHPRRSARKLSLERNTNEDKKEKSNATSKSRQQLSTTRFPYSRRKKLPWTAEEEEMLKEGVQKFSTEANKSFPWRKVLEFGRHIFEGTRTPVDLKDKWRNILAKECSTK